VIGGYIPSHLGVDSWVGFYKGKDLHYAARVRAGFVPATRRQVFDAIKQLKAAKCPFVNLPEEEAGRWGEGFTAEKMKEAVWLKPQAVAQIEFLEMGRSRRQAGSDVLVCSGSKTRITPEGIANSARRPRCGSCSTAKLSNRTDNVRFVR
jgi:ATP-dependent DNA ligase